MNDDTSEPGSAARRRPLPSVVQFVMVVALVWLGGQFVRQGVSDNLLGDKPALAVLWKGDSADAIAELARVRLQARDPGGAARLATKALRVAPLNADALTAYGLAMDAQRQPAVATRAMTLAGRRSWRDLVTQIWLFRHDMLAGDTKDAVDHADSLLRRVHEPPPAVFAILALAARNPATVGALADRLAADPNWRLPFFTFLCAQARPPATEVAGQLLTRLTAVANKPTDTEIGLYLAGLAGQGRYQAAEAAWRRLTPGAGAGYVHNGDFELPARTTPFDWWLRGGPGWIAAIADSPDPSHGRALRIDYDGDSPTLPLRQLLVLPPGAYRLSGRMLDAGEDAASGFSWRVLCAGAPVPLARAPAPPGPPGQWRTFTADFAVPVSDCPAQLLDLAAIAGDHPKSITLWYDDLAITPLPGSVAPRTQAPAPNNLKGQVTP